MSIQNRPAAGVLSAAGFYIIFPLIKSTMRHQCQAAEIHMITLCHKNIALSSTDSKYSTRGFIVIDFPEFLCYDKLSRIIGAEVIKCTIYGIRGTAV